MNDRARLLERLDAIGVALSSNPTALALIGVGSAGAETERLDRFSDLDFFVIVQPGHRNAYLADLRWLSDVAPIAYCFANTADGYKALFADGIFCEFAVFEPAQLEHIPFTQGRIVWRADGVEDFVTRGAPLSAAAMLPVPDWRLGEALTNLYVGLLRDQRGEKLSAMRFIQGYAVDQIIELAAELVQPTTATRDVFSPERRFEQRFPAIALLLPEMLQGYRRNRASARAALRFLDSHFVINAAIRQAILELCADDSETGHANER